jgi:hypothetical protein
MGIGIGMREDATTGSGFWARIVVLDGGGRGGSPGKRRTESYREGGRDLHSGGRVGSGQTRVDIGGGEGKIKVAGGVHAAGENDEPEKCESNRTRRVSGGMILNLSKKALEWMEIEKLPIT